MKLTDFKALTFDCYGTLIDWESGIINGLAPLTSRVAEPLSRDQILEAHARHESTQQRWTPGYRYSDILTIVYKRLAEQWQVTATPDACVRYGQSVADWPPFEDAAESLAYLKQHYQLVILSNVDNRSFAGSQKKLKVAFDAIYTAEDIGSYKPSDRNFEYMLEHLSMRGIQREDVLHTAESMFHDHATANKHQLSSCWIYRRHEQQGYGATMDPGIAPDYRFCYHSLADLVAAHKAEIANT